MIKISYFSTFVYNLQSIIHPFIQSKLAELTEIFKKHQVKRAYILGSAVTDNFNENSEFDFLIELDELESDPAKSGAILWDLYYALKGLLKRDVDMVTRRSLKNKYFIEELNETVIPIYG